MPLSQYLAWHSGNDIVHLHIRKWKEVEYLKIGDTLIKSAAHLQSFMFLLRE